jgi:hypothetical protein
MKPILNPGICFVLATVLLVFKVIVGMEVSWWFVLSPLIVLVASFIIPATIAVAKLLISLVWYFIGRLPFIKNRKG